MYEQETTTKNILYNQSAAYKIHETNFKMSCGQRQLEAEVAAIEAELADDINIFPRRSRQYPRRPTRDRNISYLRNMAPTPATTIAEQTIFGNRSHTQGSHVQTSIRPPTQQRAGLPAQEMTRASRRHTAAQVGHMQTTRAQLSAGPPIRTPPSTSTRSTVNIVTPRLVQASRAQAVQHQEQQAQPLARASNTEVPPTIETRTVQNINRSMCAAVSLEKMERTYHRAYKNFNEWCNRLREAGTITVNNPSEDENVKNLVPSIIDLYFSEVIIHRQVQPSNARKSLCAIQWVIKNIIPVNERFDAESEVVKECLRAQKINYENSAQRGTLPDPHAGLRIKILSYDENRKVLNHIFRKSRQWGCLCVSWNWGMRAYVRADSV